VMRRCGRHRQSTERPKHGRQLLQPRLYHDDADDEAGQDATTEWKENAADGSRCCS